MNRSPYKSETKKKTIGSQANKHTQVMTHTNTHTFRHIKKQESILPWYIPRNQSPSRIQLTNGCSGQRDGGAGSTVQWQNSCLMCTTWVPSTKGGKHLPGQMAGAWLAKSPSPTARSPSALPLPHSCHAHPQPRWVCPYPSALCLEFQKSQHPFLTLASLVFREPPRVGQRAGP